MLGTYWNGATNTKDGNQLVIHQICYNAKTRLIPNMISYREKYQNNLPSAWIKISRITSLSDFHWQYSGSLLASRCQGGITDAQSVLIYYNVQEQLKDNTINWEQEPIVLKQQSIKIMRKAERAIGL